MSLRAFHILFILLSTLLAAGCAWWALANDAGAVIWVPSAIAAVGLAWYGINFVRKSRKLVL